MVSGGAMKYAIPLLAASCWLSAASAHLSWSRTYGGTNDDEGRSVRQTTDDGYVIVGYTSSYGAGNADIYLVRTDVLGDTLYTRTFGGPGDDRGYSVERTTDGGFVVVGSTATFGAGNLDVYLVKTNATGDTLWTKTYGGRTTMWAFP
jgi:hypothetical protein